MGIEAFVASQKEALFKEYELDVHNPTDVATFDSLLHERMQMFERNAYVRLHERYVYDYPPEQVEGYLALANGSSEEDILRASNFRQEVDSLITYFQPYIVDEVNLIMIKLRAQYQPLLLKITANDKEVPLANIDLDLLLHTNTEQRPRFSILDPATAEIALPEAFDFTPMTALTIRLNGKDYTIERYNRNLPEPLQEAFSPLTREIFSDLDYWVIRLDENELRLQTTTETLFELTEGISHVEHRQWLIDSLRVKTPASLPAAIALAQQVDAFTALCDHLREEIIGRTGGYDSNKRPVGRANKEEVARLFLEEKQAEVLKNKMTELRVAMLSLTDDQIGEDQIATGAPLMNATDQSWEEYTFRNMPTAAVLPLLAKFSDDAQRDELTTLLFLLGNN